jgi:hypothetical protein
MRRSLPALFVAALLGLCLHAPAAGAAFGFKELDVTFTEDPALGGGAEIEAGAHPYAFTTTADFETKDGAPLSIEIPDGSPRDLTIAAIPGLVGNPTATRRCTTLEFLVEECPAASALGFSDVTYADPENTERVTVHNLVPPPGVAAKLGFIVNKVPLTIEAGVNPDPPYNILARLRNIPQALPVYGATTTLWGNPPAAEVPFLTLPRACEGQLQTRFSARSWEQPGVTALDTAGTHDDAVPPSPQGFEECQRLGFKPDLSVRASTRAASAPSGLDVELGVEDAGLTDPAGIADSDLKKAILTLPEGMTANPGLAEGLAACSPARFEAERVGSQPGEGCPEASKVGSVEAETPILEGRVLRGELFIATQGDNPFGSLLALYMVIRDRELGVVVKLAGKVEPDPETGRLTTIFGEPGQELPQFPVSRVRVSLREGGRSPLISPPGCGVHTAVAVLVPWADPENPLTATSSFEIDRGVNGGPCPAGSAPPFAPGLAAGALGNAAGKHSPFLLRLTRRDGDQDLVRFDATLPPGVSAKLAGVSRCPEAAIALAKAKSGRAELAAPSCPAGSRIGAALAGAGVGAQLTYVPGSVYLAGPYGGAPLSVLGVVPAVAGPFDVGTVVVRQALRLDPRTAQATVDGALSDPIPHILAGIPLAVRDVRVAIDRPDFALNPTDCSPLSAAASIWGGGGDPFSLADDAPVARAVPFQASGCGALGFKPRLAVKLRGGVRRGAHPALRAVVTPRPGDANFSRAVVTLPRSAFLEQAHIRTICTRVRFAAGPGNGALCPPGARYGYARAWSPLIDGIVQGPVYLRSSDTKLPDMVVALTGPASAPFDFELSARIDSVRGGIRSTFEGIPDLPVSRFILDMQGAKKGLIVNSRHLCHKPKRNRARANLRGQNGRLSKTKPRVVALTCAKRRKAKRARAKRSAGHVSRASRAGGGARQGDRGDGPGRRARSEGEG